MEKGTLYIVSTPIGNLKDITQRAKETLETADIIAAEDTRVTAKLKNAYGISTPQISLFEHSDKQKIEKVTGILNEGKSVALVTDAGTPLISDPGSELVKAAELEGIKVTGVPGPCAAINALVLSAFDLKRFAFEGFLPRSGKEREERLAEIAERTFVSVVYESPFRLKKTLEEFAKKFGERKIAVMREMTKMFEEVIRGSAREILEKIGEKEVKGEIVIVIDGAEQIKKEISDEDIETYAKKLIDEGESRKSAVQRTAKELNVNKNRVYAIVNK